MEGRIADDIVLVMSKDEDELEKQQKKESPLELVKELFTNHKLSLFINFLNLTFLSFNWFLGYFALKSVKGNMFINGFIYSLIDGGCNIINGKLGNKFGILPVAIFCNMIGAVAMVIKLCYEESVAIQMLTTFASCFSIGIWAGLCLSIRTSIMPKKF